MHFLESKHTTAIYRGIFRHGRRSMDYILLKDDIRKAQVNKGTVVAIFDVVKAYDMRWRE